MRGPPPQYDARAAVAFVVVESLWLEHEHRTEDIAPFNRLEELVGPVLSRSIEADPLLGDVLRLVDHWAHMLHHDEGDESIGRFFLVPPDRVRPLLFELARSVANGAPQFPQEWQHLSGRL